MSLKVMTIVGTRPEIIKLSRIIPALDRHFRHVLVHTGQNYDHELNEVFFKDLQIRKPDHFLDVAAGSTGEMIGNIVSRSDTVMEREAPDALLVYGDTNSCLSVIAAKRRKIPIFHMEAGNRCFDQRVPEELNRRIVDHVSDVNMPLSEHARRYLLSEGLRPDLIIKTGSCMKEVLGHNWQRIEASDVLSRMGLEPRRFFVLSVHREENLDAESNLRSLLASIDAIAETYAMPVILSAHPRTAKKLSGTGDWVAHPLVRVVKAVGFLDYVKLQCEAFCVVSDSGTITEEASLLGLVAVTVRQAHERPEGMDEGTVILSGLAPESVLDSIRVATSQRSDEGFRARVVPDYEIEHVSQKVVRIIQSYTGYVNRVVWGKGP